MQLAQASCPVEPAAAFRRAAALPRPLQKPARALPPFSLRLSADERARLKREAGSMPLGAYIRSRLLAGAEIPRRRLRQPARDDARLGQILGALGQSRIANNLNQIAHAANLGALALTPEQAANLREGCQAVRAMRNDLLRALGLEADDPA